jgi:hypothetical protein
MTRASIFGPVFALGLPRQIEVSRPEGCGSLRSEFGDGVTYFTLVSRSRVLHSGAIAAHRHTRRTGVFGDPFAIFAPPVLLASSSSWVSSVCPREKPAQMRRICENQRAAWLPLCPGCSTSERETRACPLFCAFRPRFQPERRFLSEAPNL